MAAYFATEIEAGRLSYLAVVSKYPQFKSDIDKILVGDGKQDLIVQV
jgi:hypothetical protein